MDKWRECPEFERTICVAVLGKSREFIGSIWRDSLVWKITLEKLDFGLIYSENHV